MSKTTPLFGVDAHPEYQAGLDFKRLHDMGYQFAFVKATQGGKYVPRGFSAYFDRVKHSGLVPGLYHFLEAGTSAKVQAAHFLRHIGNPEGKLIAVDFERYAGDGWDLSPGNALLRAFIWHLRDELGSHPIILYSGQGFWNGGDASGSFAQYGADVAWDAYYPWDGPGIKHPTPRDMYHQLRRKGYGWGQRWGGVEPVFWQFTSAGLAADKYIDINAFRGEREGLLNLTKSHKAPSLPTYISKPLETLEGAVGGPYVVWEKGNFAGKEGPPAWARNAKAPVASAVRKQGSFCAGMPNIASRVNSKFIFHSTAISWAGGVKWWGERLVDNQKVASKYVHGKQYPPGTLFLRRYTGAELEKQGHVAVMGRRGRLLQADFFGDGRDGINENRTVGETHALLQKFDGGGWQYTVAPEDWLK